MLAPYGDYIFSQISHYYPEVKKLDYNKFLIINFSANGMYWRWMALPNNQMILLNYMGMLVDDANSKFKGILPPVDSDKVSHHVYIVFDNKGRRIGGSVDAQVDQ